MTDESGAQQDHPSHVAADDTAKIDAFTWPDRDGNDWTVTLTPGNITLQCGDATVELPKNTWKRDIYVAEHGSSYIIRIDTYETAVQFVLERDRVGPLLQHLKIITKTAEPQPVEAESNEEEPKAEDRPRDVQALLWPKVSPLAVWAVMCSALVFVPLIGSVFAAATITLLLAHRRTVRRVQAFRHSRALCIFASGMLMLGGVVTVLSSHSAQYVADPERIIAAAPAPADGNQRNLGVVAAALIVIIVSLSVHEAAHAITAWWLGDDWAKSLGRVTLNPVAHVDPFGTIMLPLLLALMSGPIFGYARPVPVRVEQLPRRRRAHILISIAGPGSNLLLASLSMMLLLAAGCIVRLTAPDAVVGNLSMGRFDLAVTATGFALAPVFASLCTILKLSFLINTVLAVFNMIPIPPLDGSWVLEHLFPNSLGRIYERLRPYGFMVFVMAWYAGVFDKLIIGAVVIIRPALAMLERVTGM